MKKILIPLLIGIIILPALAMAGDCMTRDKVSWHGTITSAVFLRDDCPTEEGDVIGTIPAGEVVEILEVDRFNEFYLVRTSVGEGFLWRDFLKDIKEYPKPGGEEPEYYTNSIFPDLEPTHIYYQHISDVKEKGIVSGNDDGTIDADGPINRAALAKILVEATTDDDTIESAVLTEGIYSDIISGAWYVKYLKISRDKGIMTGDSGKTTVRPGDNANGGEVAKMIAVAFELDIEEPLAGEAWYKPYMNALSEREALPYQKGSHIVTRGEMMYSVSQVLANK